MSALLDHAQLTVPSRPSVVGFERDADGWSRYLTLADARAYLIGGACDTCDFVFERLGGANQTVSPADIGDAFRNGLDALDGDLVENAAKVLPPDRYRVLLLELEPRLVRPGESDDYFAHEAIEFWGIDGFWGLPHNPHTEYYRVGLPETARRFFEFVVPMVPRSWLNEEVVAEYETRLRAGARQTGFAISVLEVRGPHWVREDDNHWCLTHYLLDGHHKLLAAARAGLPVRVLSYLSESQAPTPELADELVGHLRPADG